MKLTQGVGSSFDSFLDNEKILEETNTKAIKRIIAYELKQTMEKEKITKTKYFYDNNKF
jgi:hypothetical protein